MCVNNGILVSSMGQYDRLRIGGNLDITAQGSLVCISSSTQVEFFGSTPTVVTAPFQKQLPGIYVNKNSTASVSLTNDYIFTSTVAVNSGVFDITNTNQRINAIERGYGGGKLEVSGSTVTFYGQSLISGNTIWFDTVQVDSGANLWIQTRVDANKFEVPGTGLVNLDVGSPSELIVKSRLDLGGKLDVNGSTVTVVNQLNVLDGGELDLSTPYAGRIRAQNVLIQDGGLLVSDSVADVVTSTDPFTYVSFMINKATVNVNGLSIDRIDSNGLTINDGAYLLNFSSVSFTNAQAGGAALRVFQAGTTQYVFNGFFFDTFTSTNVYAPYLTSPGYIYMKDATGIKSGYPYENDPNNVIFWSSPTIFTQYFISDVGISSVTWEWQDAYDESAYELTLSSGAEVLYFQLLADTTRYSVTELLANTTYEAYVRAYNPVGERYSIPSGTCTLASPPVGTYVVSRTSWSVGIGWSGDINPSYTRWEVWRSSDNFVTNQEQLTNYWTNYTSTVYVDSTSVISDTTYYYQVRAVNEYQVPSVFDVRVTTLTLDLTPPTSIYANFIATQGNEEGSIQLGWYVPGDDGMDKPLDPGSQYSIQFSSDIAATIWNHDSATINVSTFGAVPNTWVQHLVTGLQKDTTYFFRVWYRDNRGNWSDISTGATTYSTNILTHRWRGYQDTYASNSANWENNSIPSDGDNVVFEGLYSTACVWNLPSIAVSSFTVEIAYSSNIIISSHLTIDGDFTFPAQNMTIAASSITINGNVNTTGVGGFNPGTSTMAFAGGKHQYLILNNGATLWHMTLIGDTTVHCQSTVMAINGDIRFEGGSFDAYMSSVSHRGSILGSGLGVQQSSGAWILDGDNDQTLDLSSLTGTFFGNFTINKTNGSTFTVTALSTKSLEVRKDLEVKSGVFCVDPDVYVDIWGNLSQGPGTFMNCQSSAFRFIGNKNTFINLPSYQTLSNIVLNKDYAYNIVSISSPTLTIGSNLTVTRGTMDITNKVLKVKYISLGMPFNVSFNTYGSTVVINGAPGGLSGSTTFFFNVLVFDRNSNVSISTHVLVGFGVQIGTGSVVELNGESALMSDGTTDIYGDLRPKGGTLMANELLEIHGGGVLNLSDTENASVILGTGVVVYPGGRISSNSTSDVIVSSDVYGSFKVIRGTVSITGISISSVNANGIVIEDSSDVQSFENVVLTGFAPDSFGIQLLQHGTSTYVFRSVYFDASISTNVYVPNMSYPDGYVAMNDASGPRAGYQYEQDPNHVIYWSTPTVPTFNITTLSTGSLQCDWSADPADDVMFYYILTSTNGMEVQYNYNVVQHIVGDLGANTSYYRYLQALNPIASSSSTLVPRFTYARPPMNTYVTAVTSYSISIDWDGNDNPGYTRYVVLRSSTNFTVSTNTVVAMASNYYLTDFTDTEIETYTTYWYKVQALNEENVETIFDVVVSSVTHPPFVEPESEVTFPQNWVYYSPLKPISTISGTAYVVDPATVTLVQLQLQRVADNQYWDGTASWGGATWFDVTGKGEWSHSAPVPDGDMLYMAQAKAFDNYAREETILSPVYFVYDDTNPVSNVTFPVSSTTYSNLNVISGTSSDEFGMNFSTVAQVELRLYNGDIGRYYNGANWDLSVSTWFVAAGTNTWTYALPGLTSGYYRINSRAIDYAGNYEINFSTVEIYHTGPVSSLVLTAPGENLLSGYVPGKSGTPAEVTAGTAFFVTAYAVDHNYYLVDTTNTYVTISSDDGNSAPQGSAALTNGTESFSVTLRTSRTTNLTAQANTVMPGNSTVFVTTATPTGLLLLCPNQIADPGSATGKLGVPSARTAGVSFQVTASLVDDYWNVVKLNEPEVTLTASDPNCVPPAAATLELGATYFNVTLLTANTTGWVLTITDTDGAGADYGNYITTGVVVNPNYGTRLLVIVPNETYDPGTATGKMDTVTGQNINTSFNVTVYATDDWWNLQAGSNPVVSVHTTDPADIEPTPVALVNGVQIYQVTLVSQGTAYIWADGAGLISSTSSVVDAGDATPPGAVSDLTALIGPYHSSVLLTWTAPGDDEDLFDITGGTIIIRCSNGGPITDFDAPLPTSFEIVRSTNMIAGSPQSFIVTGLVSWTTYYFAIETRDSSGNQSSWSMSGVNTLSAAQAADIVNPVVYDYQPGSDTWRNAGGALYNVDFNDPDSGLDYIQYCSWTGPNKTGVERTTWSFISSPGGNHDYTTDWSVNFSSLTENYNYVSVRAFDLAGNSTEYVDAFYVLKDTTPPPSFLNVSPADNSSQATPIFFQWGSNADALSGIVSYTLEMHSNEACSNLLVSTTVTSGNSVTLSQGLTEGVRWWRVIALDAAGNYSVWSTTYSVNVFTNTPTDPSDLYATAISTTRIHLEWTDNSSNETQFRLYFTTGGYIYNLTSNVTYYTLGNLYANQRLSCMIRAYNNSGESGDSNTVVRYALANMPTSVSFASVAYNGVRLNWDSNGNASGTNYEIWWSTDSGFGAYSSGSASTTTYLTSALDPETSYYFRVYAQNGDSIYSGYETTLSTFTPAGPPAAPAWIEAVAVSTGSIRYSWTDNSVKEEGYRVYDITSVMISSFVANATSYTEGGLEPNKQYTRYVVGYNVSGEGVSSGNISRYTLANTPTGLSSGEQTSTSITLSWAAGAGTNTRYYLARSTGGVTYTTVFNWDNNVTGTTYTDSGLKVDTTYYYKIGGYNGDGILSELSSALVKKTQYVAPQVISGVVTQANGTPITGVTVTAQKDGTNVTYTVYTSTAGAYVFNLDSNTADGVYRIQASWTANNVVSSVYKEGVSNGSQNVDFTLETNYELGTISGQVTIVKSVSKAARRALGISFEAPAFIELTQNGNVIARVGTDSEGKYEVPNLLPGRFTVRAFNGVAYSKPAIVDLQEGQNFSLSFDYELLNPDTVYSYPNPAVSQKQLTIHFQTSGQDIDCQVHIYTISGELVRAVRYEELSKVDISIYEYVWDMTNSEGQNVASGVYIYQVKVRNLATGDYAFVTKKLAIIK
ncbi:MAG: fibronectin type III domain-containing protein [Endomicrobiales bacterium]|nr:fibronectin type III domain-containing protein [Endomicrobiales bacterium]